MVSINFRVLPAQFSLILWSSVFLVIEQSDLKIMDARCVKFSTISWKFGDFMLRMTCITLLSYVLKFLATILVIIADGYLLRGYLLGKLPGDKGSQ